MGFIIQIITTAFLIFVMFISGFLFLKSGITIYEIWQHGIDSKATADKLKDSFSKGVNLVVLKNQNAIYVDREIIGYSRYAPVVTEAGIEFYNIFMQGEATKLKEITIDNMFEYNNKKYKILNVYGGTGQDNGRHFDYMVHITAQKITK